LFLEVSDVVCSFAEGMKIRVEKLI
jgi:hypothetical protein